MILFFNGILIIVMKSIFYNPLGFMDFKLFASLVALVLAFLLNQFVNYENRELVEFDNASLYDNILIREWQFRFLIKSLILYLSIVFFLVELLQIRSQIPFIISIGFTVFRGWRVWREFKKRELTVKNLNQKVKISTNIFIIKDAI
jgi:hypothetical protein